MAGSHYQVLGVSPHASHDEIRRAYRRLAQRHHPDANPDAPAEARAAMADINAAWNVLGDADRRRAYDSAIGTTPRPFVYRPDGLGGIDDDDDPLAHLRDDPDAPPRRARPADLLIAIPVVLLLVELSTFAFSVMSQSNGLRQAALVMAPFTAGAFIAAPLFMMLRERGRN